MNWQMLSIPLSIAVVVSLIVFRMYRETKSEYYKHFNGFSSLVNKVFPPGGSPISEEDVIEEVMGIIAPYYPRASNPASALPHGALPADSPVVKVFAVELIRRDLAEALEAKLIGFYGEEHPKYYFRRAL